MKIDDTFSRVNGAEDEKPVVRLLAPLPINDDEEKLSKTSRALSSSLRWRRTESQKMSLPDGAAMLKSPSGRDSGNDTPIIRKRSLTMSRSTPTTVPGSLVLRQLER